MDNKVKKVGGRKFAYAILLIVLGFGLVIIGKAPSSQWFDFAGLIAGMYIVGNVGERYVQSRETKA